MPIEPGDTVASLQSRVQAAERRLLIATITEFATATPSDDRVAAVIFDLDDTLLDHTGAARKGVEGWLSRLDVEPTSTLIGHWFDVTECHYASYVRGDITFDEQRRARVRDMLAALNRTVGDDDTLDQLFEVYLTLYSAAWRPFGDVAETLALVEARGLRVAVVTNGTQRQQLQKLTAMGISERVGPVFCSDALGCGKPDPRIFHAACAALGVQPQAALNVGDNYELDVTGARAAGLQAVHLDRTGTSTCEEAARISSLRELGCFL